MLKSIRMAIVALSILETAVQAQGKEDYDPYDSLVAIAVLGDVSTTKNEPVVPLDGVLRKVVAIGSGFCVAKNYFVTNEHVVPSGLLAVIWTRTTGPHQVEVAARDKDDDLALLHFDGNTDLRSQPATLSMKPWKSLGGTEFYYAAIVPILLPGSRPELTPVQRRINVVGSTAVHKRILFEPETMAGNSGSPIVQRDYSVIGVVQGNFLNKGWQGVAKAIPSEFVAAFLRKNGIDFAQQDD